MKKMKKIFAMILSLAMVLGMSLTVFATEVPSTPLTRPNHKPASTDKAKATVSNVEAGATVTAYRIVEPTYNDKGFTGYQLVEVQNTDAGTGETKREPISIENMLEPTSNEITTIASDKALLAQLEQRSLTAPEGATGLTTFTGPLEAGYWVIIVTGSDIQEVYNPMLVGIYYSVEGSGDNDVLVNGEVNADSNWSLNSTPAYAKSSKPTLDKKITGSTGKDTSDGNASGNDVAIGDTVNFEIDTVIPQYSGSYKATGVRVEISDQLSEGLTLSGEPVVQVGNTTLRELESTYEYIEGTPNNGFTIKFNSDFALERQGQSVVVEYEAVLNEKAGVNFDSNTNTAKLTYTNDPSDKNHIDEIEDKTYTYTFAIDANLYGEDESAWNKFTEELLKTGEKRTITLEDGTTKETTTLPGATFTLTSTDRADKKVYTAVSDENGYLSFAGLDAGKYNLQETKAPEGYSLNDVVIPVEITATYNEDGTLKSYVIKVDNQETSTYTATYSTTNSGRVENIDCTPGHDNDWSDISDTHEIKNTKLANLPSTGGIGTTIFTIGGCAIMIIAAGLFFASRRKSDAK